jgi:hypothetical protein
MAETNPCKCADPSVGPTKSTASSFSFQICDGMELVSVPASSIADYIINVIYGNTEGEPPAEGCYNVCYDGSGNRSINLAESPRLQSESVLQTQETLFPIVEGDPNARISWNLPNPSFLAFTQQPPTGFIPTYAKLKFTSYFGGSGGKIVEILDKYENPVYRLVGDNSDDDGAHTGEVWVPVDDNGGNVGVFLSGVTNNAYVNIKLVGFTNAAILTSDGTVIGDIGDGGDGGSGNITETTTDPLGITYLKHEYNSGSVDITVIEFTKDTTLLEGTDDYTILVDFGGNDIRSVTVPHTTSTSPKQRVTINWTVDKALRVEVKAKSPTASGSVRSSDTGSIDASITIPKDITTQTI